MAPRIRDSKKWKHSEWRRSDKARRQAIHAFIKSRREELLRDVPHWALRSKDAKRNELVRVGRRRFAEQPEDVQARYFDMVEVGGRVRRRLLQPRVVEFWCLGVRVGVQVLSRSLQQQQCWKMPGLKHLPGRQRQLSRGHQQSKKHQPSQRHQRRLPRPPLRQ